MHLLVVAIDQQHYALPLDAVERGILAVEITPLPNAPDYTLGAINLRGRVIPVLSLRHLLHLPSREIGINDHFVICHMDQKTVALWVDEVRQVKLYADEELLSGDKVMPDLAYVQSVIKEEAKIIILLNLERLIPRQFQHAISNTKTPVSALS